MDLRTLTDAVWRQKACERLDSVKMLWELVVVDCEIKRISATCERKVDLRKKKIESVSDHIQECAIVMELLVVTLLHFFVEAILVSNYMSLEFW